MMRASSINVLPPNALPADPATGRGRLWLDRLGITASVACAIHCLAAPLLLLLLPTAGAVWSDPAVHWLLALLVLPLAVWVIYRGYRRHGKRSTLTGAVLGSAFIIAGLIAPMVSTQPLFTTPVPSFASVSPATASTTSAGLTPAPDTSFASAKDDAATGSCSAACCPVIEVEQATYAQPAKATLGFPAGGVLTMIGSVLLVLAHATNLHACRCFAASSCEDTNCGCPTNA